MGYDVLTIQEAGNADRSISDESVLAFAIANQRAVLTINRRHFIRLHHERPEHEGIVVCSFDPDFQALAQRIDQAVCQKATEQPSLNGVLLRINRPD
jgi:hypothetical protein